MAKEPLEECPRLAGLGVGVLAVESEKSLPTGLKVLVLLLTVLVGDNGPPLNTYGLLLAENPVDDEEEDEEQEFTVNARGASHSMMDEALPMPLFSSGDAGVVGAEELVAGEKMT